MKRSAKREILLILLQLIPPGKVTTYGSLARILKTSPRVVGMMLKRNERLITIPCHRVVESSRRLGGYSVSGKSRRDFKLKLLKLEGVCFNKSRVSSDSVILLDSLLLLENRRSECEVLL
ncbi:MAG: MGMT family protein [Sulfolobales archaeon]|nr:MGMT family protein [Sulfolobales archaeon]MCX8208438.1 MGMT family protein [Sulfolobales archaeon]MDW8010611.1 MGMT family protein [Sulfolobales archaeon]